MQAFDRFDSNKAYKEVPNVFFRLRGRVSSHVSVNTTYALIVTFDEAGGMQYHYGTLIKLSEKKGRKWMFQAVMDRLCPPIHVKYGCTLLSLTPHQWVSITPSAPFGTCWSFIHIKYDLIRGPASICRHSHAHTAHSGTTASGSIHHQGGILQGPSSHFRNSQATTTSIWLSKIMQCR